MCFWANMQILCYFFEVLEPFNINQELFGVLRAHFENGTEFMCYFLCYFLKSPEFGKFPEFREQGTALVALLLNLIYNTTATV